MKIKFIFDEPIAKELVYAEGSNSYPENRLSGIEKRLLELNSTREKMSNGYRMVLEGLADAYQLMDWKEPDLANSTGRITHSLLKVCSGLGAKNGDANSNIFSSEKYNKVIILKDITCAEFLDFIRIK